MYAKLLQLLCVLYCLFSPLSFRLRSFHYVVSFRWDTGAISATEQPLIALINPCWAFNAGCFHIYIRLSMCVSCSGCPAQRSCEEPGHQGAGGLLFASGFSSMMSTRKSSF